METKKIHFMGILGSGCSATAAIAKAQGFLVSGCDAAHTSEYQHELTASGITVQPMHNKDHAYGIDLLVVSPAILAFDNSNPELITARKERIPIISWQEFSAGYLQKDKFVIAICGSHGKSTTTAMVANILVSAGLDPTVQLGAVVPQWHSNYRVGKGKYYVIEADEYNNNFLYYHPDIIAVTNIEYDHPEFFPTPKAYEKAFADFVQNLKPQGTLLLSNTITQHFDAPKIERIAPQPLHLTIPGEFNIANASLAFAVVKAVGVDNAIAQNALESFTGLARRLERKGEVNGITIVDDYGHHPSEIIATANAARAAYPNKTFWLVFQPHMFTRTKVLFNDFVQALREVPADHLIVADIFASREHDTGEVNASDIVAAVAKQSVFYGGSLINIEKILSESVKSNSVVVCMGAGDITKLSNDLLKDFSQAPAQ